MVNSFKKGISTQTFLSCLILKVETTYVFRYLIYKTIVGFYYLKSNNHVFSYLPGRSFPASLTTNFKGYRYLFHPSPMVDQTSPLLIPPPRVCVMRAIAVQTLSSLCPKLTSKSFPQNGKQAEVLLLTNIIISFRGKSRKVEDTPSRSGRVPNLDI